VRSGAPGPDGWLTQRGHSVRFELGPAAGAALTGEICVVVDVLRFTTAVEAAVARGAAVYPYRWRNAGTAREFAESVGAVLATRDDGDGPSLSPSSMSSLPPGTSLVLPSPNGSTCSVVASEAGAQVAAGCLRNAAAVGAWAAAAAATATRPVTVIACGERWPDGSLRPSLEDLLGAGAILSHLGGQPSPEARAAIAAFRDAEDEIPEIVRQCASGLELAVKNREADVEYAAQLDVSTVVPVLTGGAFGQNGSAIHMARATWTCR
jgi:2-phosphosulfolactate phosphatase